MNDGETALAFEARTTITTGSATYYIDHNATGSGDGSSWANAFTSFGNFWDAMPKDIYHTITVKVAGSAYSEYIYFTGKNVIGYVYFEAYDTNDNPLYDTGSATSGGNDYIEDTSKSGDWVDNQFDGGIVCIYWGTGKGQYRTIDTCNSLASDQKVYVTSNWTTNPDATSKYMIISKITYTTTSNGTISVANIYFTGFQIGNKRISISQPGSWFMCCKLSLDVYGVYMYGSASGCELHYNLHITPGNYCVYAEGVSINSDHSVYISSVVGSGYGIRSRAGSHVAAYRYNHFKDLAVGFNADGGSDISYTTEGPYASFDNCTTKYSPAFGSDFSAIW